MSTVLEPPPSEGEPSTPEVAFRAFIRPSHTPSRIASPPPQSSSPPASRPVTIRGKEAPTSPRMRQGAPRLGGLGLGGVLALDSNETSSASEPKAARQEPQVADVPAASASKASSTPPPNARTPSPANGSLNGSSGVVERPFLSAEMPTNVQPRETAFPLDREVPSVLSSSAGNMDTKSVPLATPEDEETDDLKSFIAQGAGKSEEPSSGAAEADDSSSPEMGRTKRQSTFGLFRSVLVGEAPKDAGEGDSDVEDELSSTVASSPRTTMASPTFATHPHQVEAEDSSELELATAPELSVHERDPEQSEEEPIWEGSDAGTSLPAEDEQVPHGQEQAFASSEEDLAPRLLPIRDGDEADVEKGQSSDEDGEEDDSASEYEPSIANAQIGTATRVKDVFTAPATAMVAGIAGMAGMAGSLGASFMGTGETTRELPSTLKHRVTPSIESLAQTSRASLSGSQSQDSYIDPFLSRSSDPFQQQEARMPHSGSPLAFPGRMGSPTSPARRGSGGHHRRMSSLDFLMASPDAPVRRGSLSQNGSEKGSTNAEREEFAEKGKTREQALPEEDEQKSPVFSGPRSSSAGPFGPRSAGPSPTTKQAAFSRRSSGSNLIFPSKPPATLLEVFQEIEAQGDAAGVPIPPPSPELSRSPALSSAGSMDVYEFAARVPNPTTPSRVDPRAVTQWKTDQGSPVIFATKPASGSGSPSVFQTKLRGAGPPPVPLRTHSPPRSVMSEGDDVGSILESEVSDSVYVRPPSILDYDGHFPAAAYNSKHSASPTPVGQEVLATAAESTQPAIPPPAPAASVPTPPKTATSTIVDTPSPAAARKSTTPLRSPYFGLKMPSALYSGGDDEEQRAATPKPKVPESPTPASVSKETPATLAPTVADAVKESDASDDTESTPLNESSVEEDTTALTTLQSSVELPTGEVEATEPVASERGSTERPDGAPGLAGAAVGAVFSGGMALGYGAYRGLSSVASWGWRSRSGGESTNPPPVQDDSTTDESTPAPSPPLEASSASTSTAEEAPMAVLVPRAKKKEQKLKKPETIPGSFRPMTPAPDTDTEDEDDRVAEDGSNDEDLTKGVIATKWGEVHFPTPKGIMEEFQKVMEELGPEETSRPPSPAVTSRSEARSETASANDQMDENAQRAAYLAASRAHAEAAEEEDEVPPLPRTSRSLSPKAARNVVDSPTELSPARSKAYPLPPGLGATEPADSTSPILRSPSISSVSSTPDKKKRASIFRFSKSSRKSPEPEPLETFNPNRRPSAASLSSVASSDSSSSTTRRGSILLGSPERRGSKVFDTPEKRLSQVLDPADAPYVDYTSPTARRSSIVSLEGSPTIPSPSVIRKSGKLKSCLKQTSKYDSAAGPRKRHSGLNQSIYGVRFANAGRGLGLRTVAEDEAERGGNKEVPQAWVGVGRGRYGNLKLVSKVDNPEQLYAEQTDQIKTKWRAFGRKHDWADVKVD